MAMADISSLSLSHSLSLSVSSNDGDGANADNVDDSNVDVDVDDSALDYEGSEGDGESESESGSDDALACVTAHVEATAAAHPDPARLLTAWMAVQNTLIAQQRELQRLVAAGEAQARTFALIEAELDAAGMDGWNSDGDGD